MAKWEVLQGEDPESSALRQLENVRHFVYSGACSFEGAARLAPRLPKRLTNLYFWDSEKIERIENALQLCALPLLEDLYFPQSAQSKPNWLIYFPKLLKFDRQDWSPSK